MPRTIDEGFRDFLRNLTPTSYETEAAKKHRASIEACLKNNYNLRRFFRTGSFGNGTSIFGYSDVDYFASIPSENLSQNSSTSLTRIRNTFDARFPRTGVRVSCPTIIVPFGTDAKETTEVVPAKLDKVAGSNGNKFFVYQIADCSGGWMLSSPDIHNLYVRSIDQKLSSKVKPLVRFVKAWKYYQNVPISSFYLELRVTKFVEDMKSIVYDIDLNSFFGHLSRVDLAAMQDPMKISGYISPCSTQAKLSEAKSKLATAASRAQKAREAIRNENIKDAFYWWNLLFNGNLPGY